MSTPNDQFSVRFPEYADAFVEEVIGQLLQERMNDIDSQLTLIERGFGSTSESRAIRSDVAEVQALLTRNFETMPALFERVCAQVQERLSAANGSLDLGE